MTHSSLRTPLRACARVCLMLSLAACTTPLETIRLRDIGPLWQVGAVRDLGEGHGVVTMFVPLGEEMHDWTRMVMIEFLEGNPLTPEQALESERAELIAECPGMDWDVIVRGAHSITYEFHVVGCAGQPDYTELGRMLQGNDGLHRVSYTVRRAWVDPGTRQVWMRRFRDAVVIKGDDMEVVVLRDLD